MHFCYKNSSACVDVMTLMLLQPITGMIIFGILMK